MRARKRGANKLSLALTLIPSGVNFDADENDPVKLLIVLAATDSTSHIEAISQLAKLFDNEKRHTGYFDGQKRRRTFCLLLRAINSEEHL